MLFRFALAALKLCEPILCSSSSSGSVHHCLSRISDIVNDYPQLAQVTVELRLKIREKIRIIMLQYAFNELNPFSHKAIENRRTYYLNQLRKSNR